jgi:hypothetical protein
MTSANEQQPVTKLEPKPERPPEPPHAAHRSVWWAGVLGGLLGAALSFVLVRSFPPVPKPPPAPPPSEARQFADEVVRKLKTGENQEFKKYVRSAFAQLPDKDFDEFCQQFVFNNRKAFADAYGPPVDFEFARETVLVPALVRVTYAEKYARGCLLWVIVVYNSPDGWQVAAFSLDGPKTGYSALQ